MLFGDATSQAADLWDEVVSCYRQACFCRRRGQVERALKLVNGSLRRAIASWMGERGEDNAELQRILAGMFEAEDGKVADAVLIADTVEESLASRLPLAVSSSVQSQLGDVLDERLGALLTHLQRDDTRTGSGRALRGITARVPVGDVAAMIDCVLAEERSEKQAVERLGCRTQ